MRRRKPIIIIISEPWKFYCSWYFYAPARLFVRLYSWVARRLIISARNMFGGRLGGYRTVIALKLRAHAARIQRDVMVDIVSYTNNLQKEQAMKAINSDIPHPYVCKDDRKLDPKERTTFMVKYIDPFSEANFGDELYGVKQQGKERKESIKSGTQKHEILKKFLCGWDNLPDETGEAVEFDASDMDKNLKRLHPAIRTEIADHIRGESEMTEGEG